MGCGLFGVWVGVCFFFNYFLHGFSAMFISVTVHPVFEDSSPSLKNHYLRLWKNIDLCVLDMRNKYSVSLMIDHQNTSIS